MSLSLFSFALLNDLNLSLSSFPPPCTAQWRDSRTHPVRHFRQKRAAQGPPNLAISVRGRGRRNGEKESGITRITALSLSFSLWTEGITLDLHRPLFRPPLNPHFNTALSAGRGRSLIGQRDGLSNEARFIQPAEKGSGQLREVGNLPLSFSLNGLNGLMAQLHDALPAACTAVAQKLLFMGGKCCPLARLCSSAS